MAALQEALKDMPVDSSIQSKVKLAGSVALAMNIAAAVGGLTLAFASASVLPAAIGLGAAAYAGYSIYTDRRVVKNAINDIFAFNAAQAVNNASKEFLDSKPHSAASLLGRSASFGTGIGLFGVMAASGGATAFGIGLLATYMTLAGGYFTAKSAINAKRIFSDDLPDIKLPSIGR